ncbi:MAG: BrnT family toxin [Terriglobales bacterium]
MEALRFEWDEAKNLSNRRKHGVSFEEAAAVFSDPLCVSVQDRINGGELRWQTLGLVEGLLLLAVAHTVGEEREDNTLIEVIRIISARPATRKERLRYEEENG